MALRWPLEARFEQFWTMVPEWLSDGLWGLILSSSELWWPEWLSDGLWRLVLSSSGLVDDTWQMRHDSRHITDDT